MVNAMGAIAVLGFLVWAFQNVMGLPICEFGRINITVCWNLLRKESPLLFRAFWFTGSRTTEKSLLLNNQPGTL
jgi:hypothetical protein